VPLTSRFGHWDHHWFVWLPRHPVYEAVEILSRDTPGDPRKLVIVFFTERAGGKRQDFYLDNADAVAQWPGGLYRPIRYTRSGTDEGTQGVRVAFTDKDGHPVEVEVAVDARPLRPGGLTNQSGHSATQHFLVFFRAQQALAVQNRVVIDGQDFSFNTDEGVEGQYRFKAAYSAQVSSVSMPFTTIRFRPEPGQLVSSMGHVFRPTRMAEDGMAYVSTAVGHDGRDSTVTLALEAGGGLTRYVHAVGAHRFDIHFSPPLRLELDAPPAAVTYRMSLDDVRDLVMGQVITQCDGQSVLLEWQHTQPLWAQAYRFQSVITREESGGYTLEVRPVR
jgi:hypothetical protein